ncbi:hypothetical protein AX16_008600 [Volvariella volvacea WC 439]|nr:hypothetical protein AX16_008600 [Volvariella volvacea WC 439]
MGLFDFFDLSHSAAHPVHTQHVLDFCLSFAPPRTTKPAPRSHHPDRPLPRPVSMPIEVILSIIEAAYYDHSFEPDTRLLTNCALVCRSWRLPAQRLLFTHVTLRSQWAFDAFKYAVDPSTSTGRILGGAVVRLRVILDQNQPFCLSQSQFAEAVSLCPNLYDLNLALYGSGVPGEDVIGSPNSSRMQRSAPAFDDETLRVLKTATNNATLTSLSFANWSENHQSVNQLLDVWPKLKSLVISGTPPQLPHHAGGIGDASSEPHFPCHLEELRMNFQNYPSVGWLEWLLHNSVDSLRVLELEREPTSEVLEYLVDAYGRSLWSLALPSCGTHEQAVAVKKCPVLKEVKLESAWACPIIFKGLSDTIEHLAFGLDRDSALQPVLDLVRTKEGSGRKLKVVTVHVWDGGDQHPQLSALKIACAYRGIDLRLSYDVRMFRVMTRGDPVSTMSFPRVKAIENLHRMRSA